ncbi:MAG: diaminopimelate epimerase [Lachnospiraceae bacterium]|nr:diaminopimelate epimerase [Lachnospiraceae bacterium]
MRFTKMHGLGNDFICVNCFEEEITVDPGRIAELVCHRHFGIGADGLLLIRGSDVADFRMDLYNADATRAEMCGNGIRCLAKFVYDHGLTNMQNITVETLAGIKKLDLSVKDDKCRLVSVDMGQATLNSNGVSRLLTGEDFGSLSAGEVLETVNVSGKDVRFVVLDTGVPHAVLFVTRSDEAPVLTSGPVIECHTRFPARTNVDFAEVADRTHIRLRVWERGVGETMACGTGATAAATAAALLGLCDRSVDVRLPGGTLNITVEDNGHLTMCGPATEVYTGEFNI